MPVLSRERLWGEVGQLAEMPCRRLLLELGSVSILVHPIWMPGRYNNFKANKKVSKEDGVWVVPISVGLPQCSFSSFFFKLMPLVYSKIMTRLANDPVVLYFHPWEFMHVSDKNASFVFRWGNKKLGGKLERYISWCKNQGYDFKTISDTIPE